MEEFILALSANDVRVTNLLTEEMTLGNYLKSRLKGEKGLNYRRHPKISMLDNLCVHPLPLRFFKHPKKIRLQQILQKATKVLENYMAVYGRPDLIFHHGVFDYTYITRELSRRFSIPYWFKEHSSLITDTHIPCANDFESIAHLTSFVQEAERRFAPSEYYAQSLQSVFGAPFETLHNYLGPEHFEAIVQKPQPPPFELLNVALMSPVKNQKLLIEAFAKAVREKGLDARLTIAGDGQLREALLGLGRDLNLGDRLRIMHFQNRAEIRALFDSSHAFVLSSSKESFGLVLIEAMARGLPVICSRIPGPMDLINSQVGILFESNNETALTAALLEMVARYHHFNAELISANVSQTYGPEALGKRLFP